MTKAKMIMGLAVKGLGTREIADSVGCLPEYVRVVVNQRKGRGSSEVDRRYERSALGRATRRESKQKRGAKKNAYYRALRAGGDHAGAKT